jgi:sugar lactone lactonase YvrE
MQDGSHDQWMGGPEVGDWWMGNQSMQRALEFAGYQVRHVWGEGPHSGRHATALFPDAMRWLWKDWPQPITAGESQNVFLKAILQPGQEWQPVAGGHSSTGPFASDQRGEVFFQNVANQKICRITSDGKVGDYCAAAGADDGLAFGPDGRLYVADASAAKIVAYDAAGKPSTIADGIRGRNLVVTHNGNIYVAEPDKVWLVKPSGEKLTVDTGLNQATGIALSPDGLWLAVAENKTHWGYSYSVQPDGTLQNKQQFYWFHVPDWADDSGVRAWCMDRDGRLYAATRMGVQVFDRNGRSRCILPVPGGQVTGVCFGGANFDTLYVTCGDKVYKRALKVQGAPTWAAPSKLPPWGAG